MHRSSGLLVLYARVAEYFGVVTLAIVEMQLELGGDDEGSVQGPSSYREYWCQEDVSADSRSDFLRAAHMLGRIIYEGIEC